LIPNFTPFVAGVINAKVGDRPITDMEIPGAWFLFYLAGLDTIYVTLG